MEKFIPMTDGQVDNIVYNAKISQQAVKNFKYQLTKIFYANFSWKICQKNFNLILFLGEFFRLRD